jgi:hypothetical protein
MNKNTGHKTQIAAFHTLGGGIKPAIFRCSIGPPSLDKGTLPLFVDECAKRAERGYRVRRKQAKWPTGWAEQSAEGSGRDEI